MHDPPDEVLEQARARVGRACGKYRVDRLIGIGGMASVFEGTHLRNANRVALKILHRDLARKPDMRARFLREGYAANSVGHPGAVRVLDDDEAEDGSIFLVMELLDGETLDARFERSRGRVSVSEVVALVVDVLDVLTAAHRNGVVHRDIKPENLFLTREGKVKLLDFGIARLKTVSPTRTAVDASFGTPAFMSPEQALGRTEEVDAQSDVWAVGATAFLLLSGRYVHQSPTAAEMIVRRGSVPAPKLASLARVPLVIAAVIDRALAFDRAARWPSAQAMKDALVEARRVAPPEEIDEEEAGEHAKVALPSRAGSAALASLATIAAPDHVSSTVAGVVTSGEARRVRFRRTSLALALGATVAGVVVLLVALSSGSPTPPSTAPAVSTPALPAIESLARAQEPSVPAPTASQAGSAAPWMPVEALPKAIVAAPAVSRSTAAPAARARSNPPAQTSGPAATTGAEATTRKHDPLSPW
jgi:serine/threonine protein kinase